MMHIKRLLTLLLVLVSLTAGAQQPYERKDFTFKTTKVKNAEGEISAIKFGTYVAGQLVKEYNYELEPALSEEMAEHVGTFSEEDINFDGYPDVDIYLGYMGGFANNTQHEALLWNQSQHCFVEPEGYSGIGEPQLHAERKYITTVLSAGPDKRVTSYYRWHGHRLVHYLDDVWAIEDDEYVNFDEMLNLPLWRYDGKLDGRISVIIALQYNDAGDARGYIYYPKTKKPEPIMLNGDYKREGNVYSFNVNEYLPGGRISGYLRFKHHQGGGWDDLVEGTWTNPYTEKQMQLTDVTISHECPKWFTKSLFPHKNK